MMNYVIVVLELRKENRKNIEDRNWISNDIQSLAKYFLSLRIASYHSIPYILNKSAGIKLIYPVDGGKEGICETRVI